MIAMLPRTLVRRAGAVLLACGLAALLSACFVTPGQFVSTLDIRKDGRFSYTYQGEIFLLAFSELGKNGKDEAFAPSACYKEDSGEERDCTGAELAQQSKDWSAGVSERTAKRKKEAEEMRAFLGGIDPSYPKAASKFAEKLQRQNGWKRVVHKGGGLFDVDFAANGVLSYDFAFPTMEQVANTNPFVQLSLRSDGTVRLDAPAFGNSASDPLRMMAMGQGLADSSDKDMPKFPKVSGSFTLTTDAGILSNNTDEGPQTDPAGQRLHWTVGGQTGAAAPMALLQLRR